MHLKRIPVNARHTPQEAALYIDCLTTPRAGTPLLPTPAVLQAPIVVTIRVDIHESLLKQNKETYILVASRPYHGWQWQLELKPYKLVNKESHNFPPSRAPIPAFGSPSRRSAGLAEEGEEYAAVYGPRQVDVDGDVEIERASSRGKKKRTLARAQAEEAPAPAEGGREREKRRIREDFEVTAQRLQDITNAFVACAPPLDINVFSMWSVL